MKNIVEYLNVDVKADSALYLKNDEDHTYTIHQYDKNNKPLKMENIVLMSDNEFGVFFAGPYEELKKLQTLIEEETHLEKDTF